MRILLTNDDGYSSFLLQDLYTFLSSKFRDSEIQLFVPYNNCSGISSALTISSSIRFAKFEKNHYVVEGYPVDCVKIATSYLGKFDIVISGPNIGSNLGDDVVYSGTVAAARQAAACGMPAIALSVVDDTVDVQTVDIKTWHAFLECWLTTLIEIARKHKGCFVNVNAPLPISLELREAPLSQRYYNDFMKIEHKEDGKQKEYILNPNISLDYSKMQKGTDWQLCTEGYAVFSVVHMMPTCMSSGIPLH